MTQLKGLFAKSKSNPYNSLIINISVEVSATDVQPSGVTYMLKSFTWSVAKGTKVTNDLL
jgi:hypothetical protein